MIDEALYYGALEKNVELSKKANDIVIAATALYVDFLINKKIVPSDFELLETSLQIVRGVDEAKSRRENFGYPVEDLK